MGGDGTRTTGLLSQMCCPLNKVFTHLSQSPNHSWDHTKATSGHPNLSSRSLPRARIPQENQNQRHRCIYCLIQTP